MKRLSLICPATQKRLVTILVDGELIAAAFHCDTCGGKHVYSPYLEEEETEQQPVLN